MSIKNKHREENEKIVMGMEMGHLVEDGAAWWDKVAVDLMRKRNFSSDSKLQQESLNATNPVHPNYLGGKSGIMLGYKWNMLRPDERYRVIKAYALTLKGSTIQIGGA